METIKSTDSHTAYLKIVEIRAEGETHFDVEITDKVQKEKFERETKHLINEINKKPGRSGVVITIK